MGVENKGTNKATQNLMTAQHNTIILYFSKNVPYGIQIPLSTDRRVLIVKALQEYVQYIIM